VVYRVVYDGPLPFTEAIAVPDVALRADDHQVRDPSLAVVRVSNAGGKPSFPPTGCARSPSPSARASLWVYR
jgi:hypothetical protein